MELTKDAEILVTGALTREVVRGIVKEHAMEIRYCYEQALTQAPHVGKLVTTWHIDAAGLVTRVETDAEQVSAESLASCLSKKIATWRLPATGAGGERTVSYPFYFERGGS